MEIRIVQKSILEVFEGDEIISQTIVSNDLALGRLHDANMLLKGWTVDRMTKIHKEELKITEEKQASESVEESFSEELKQECASDCAKE